MYFNGIFEERSISINNEQRAIIKEQRKKRRGVSFFALCSLLFCNFSFIVAFMEKHKNSYVWLKIILIGIIVAIANNASILVNFSSGLYLDTIFTVAAAFAGGLVPGLISAVNYGDLRNGVFYRKRNALFWG